MKIEFTSTEIAHCLCAADALDEGSHPEITRRVKHLSERKVLQPLRAIDARGTFVFARLEVFRAALACEIMGLGFFAPAIDTAFKAASFDHPAGGPVAPSRLTEAGVLSRGGLRNAIAGIAAGEDWNLHIWRQPPGLLTPEALRAAYAWAEVSADDVTALSRASVAEGVRPVRSRAVIALRPIFEPLLSIVGNPE
jgi:hypothetical protein